MGNVIFVVIFVIFCAFLLGAGLISKRWVKESSDFVLAGREISTPINVVGVIAIGFAGTTVTLAPGFTIQYGLLGGLGWGVIYSVCGLLIFGLLYSNFVRRSGAQTLPEFLEMRYDGHTRSVVAITSVIGMCGIMANNVVSSVDNIAAFTGWNRLAITAIIFAVIIVFTFVSGLWATTITDLFQVLIGVIVVPATFFILAGRFGWLDAISANWGAGDFMSQGFVGALPGMKLTYPSVFNFIICFAVALVWGNNYYWMKVANCRSEKVARRSFVAAAIILIVVFMVPPVLHRRLHGRVLSRAAHPQRRYRGSYRHLRLCGQDLRVSVWLPWWLSAPWRHPSLPPPPPPWAPPLWPTAISTSA